MINESRASPGGWLATFAARETMLIHVFETMVSVSRSTDSTIDKPHQPLSFSFPKRQFGKKNIVYRSFQASWFSSWPWLHYDEANDTVLCHLCTRAVTENKMKPGNSDAAFVSYYIKL